MHKFIEDHKDDEKYTKTLATFIDENTGKAKQPPLIRAWAKVTGYVGGGKAYTDGHKDGFIHRNEFKKYLKYCFLYNELFTVFMVDAEDDKRISLEEFQREVPNFVEGTTPEQLEKVFKVIDVNGGGQILFDEFSQYVIAEIDGGE